MKNEDKDAIKELVNEVADEVVQKSSQENPHASRFRSRGQPSAVSAKETSPPASEPARGPRKLIKKSKSPPAALPKKGQKSQAEEEQKEEHDENPDENMEAEHYEDASQINMEENNDKSQIIDKEDALKNIASSVMGTFLYKPLVPLPNLTPYLGCVVEIRVASEYLVKSNKAYAMRNFWGTDIYTSDSDMVCIMQHSGLFNIGELPPDKIAGVSIYCRVTKGRNNYQSSLRKSIRSRKLGSFEGCSIRPEHFKVLDSLGNKEELIQMAKSMPETFPTSYRKNKYPLNSKYIIAPPETEVIFNLSSEPAYKFSLPAFADYSCDLSQRTSNVLQKNALYFETFHKRYELVKEGEKEKYKLSEVIEPFFKDTEFMAKNEIPLKTEFVKPIINGMEWKEFRWAENCSLHVKDLVIEGITNFKYFPIQSPK